MLSKIILKNNFHNTTAKVHVHLGAELSRAQIRRVRKTLCPVLGCTCGGTLKQSGRQDVNVVQYDLNRIVLNAKSY